MARRRGIDTRVKIIGIVILAVLVANYVVSGDTFTTGYGGLTAEIVGVVGPLPEHTVPTNDGIIAEWDPPNVFMVGDICGVKMEILGRVNIMGGEEEGEPITEVIDNGDGTWTQKVWQRTIQKMELGVMVTTSGGGYAPNLDTIFTILIEENQFDLFTAADDTRAYLIEAYVVEVTENTPLLKVSPSSGGMNVRLTSTGFTDVPDWIYEAGYQAPISQTASATFELKVDHAEADSWFRIYGRTEQSASWTIGIDVLTFGYWEKIGPNKDFDPPETDFLGALLAAMPAIIIVAAGIGAALIVLIVISRFWIMTKMAAASK